jgi:hypothetical protein
LGQTLEEAEVSLRYRRIAVCVDDTDASMDALAEAVLLLGDPPAAVCKWADLVARERG